MIRPITKLHAVCPHCGETTESSIDHLKNGQQFGPWCCNHCNEFYQGIARGADTVVEKDPKGRRKIDTLVLLEYPPSDKPLRFVISHARYPDSSDPEGRDPGQTRYFFEEHSCPTNWLKDVEMVAFDGDTDPHGFLRFVREIDCPDMPDNGMDCDQVLIGEFPEMLFTKPIKP